MKIAIVASEMVPFARSGGLGDVVGALVLELGKMGHDVRVILPKYKHVHRQRFRLKRLPDLLEVPMGKKLELVMIQQAKLPYATEAFFVDKPDLFDRDELYGTPQGPFEDNDKRFVLFQRAALEILRQTGFKPDVIHCHDWQTGLIPLMLKTRYSEEAVFKKTRTVFTFHNLSEQGAFPPDMLPEAGLDWREPYAAMMRHEGKVNFLKAGILFSDTPTTVSRRYAEEAQTPELGAGLDEAIRQRSEGLEGITNGVDVDLWNPEVDSALAQSFSKESLEGRRENALALEKELGLASEDTPLLGFVGRLSAQKGIDLLIAALPEMLARKMRVIILGKGEAMYQGQLQDIAEDFQKHLSVHVAYDETLARRIYAASDAIFFPSRFEPCGLGQMIALRYGAVPIARKTGGFMDIITPWGADGGKANGFLFETVSKEALLDAFHQALTVFQKKSEWRALLERCMSTDVSWKAAAKKYADVYKKSTRKALLTVSS